MHDGDELCLELDLHIMGNVFDSGCNGVPDVEWGIYDDVKVFNLEVCLVQGLEEVSIVKAVVKRYSEVGVHDGSDKGGVFSGGRK